MELALLTVSLLATIYAVFENVSNKLPKKHLLPLVVLWVVIIILYKGVI